MHKIYIRWPKVTELSIGSTHASWVRWLLRHSIGDKTRLYSVVRSLSLIKQELVLQLQATAPVTINYQRYVNIKQLIGWFILGLQNRESNLFAIIFWQTIIQLWIFVFRMKSSIHLSLEIGSLKLLVFGLSFKCSMWPPRFLMHTWRRWWKLAITFVIRSSILFISWTPWRIFSLRSFIVSGSEAKTNCFMCLQTRVTRVRSGDLWVNNRVKNLRSESCRP